MPPSTVSTPCWTASRNDRPGRPGGGRDEGGMVETLGAAAARRNVARRGLARPGGLSTASRSKERTMATRVDFSAKSGAAASGEIGLPAGDGKAPALVLIQEWWGVNDHI